VTDNEEPSPKALKELPFGLPSLLSRISGPHQQAAPVPMLENAISTASSYVSG
jgi:hypothetical protein